MDGGKEILETGYFGSVAGRLQLACRLYGEYGGDLLGDRQIREALRVLQRSTELLALHMRYMGVAEICTSCAGYGNGGCCSLYMANETDSIQLLMNMLAGVDVRMVRSDGIECCYLTDRGCLFLFKPMFCLNYNCYRISGPQGRKDRLLLEQLTGRSLGDQHQLEQRLLACISGGFCRRTAAGEKD